jgi:O-antigen ligase
VTDQEKKALSWPERLDCFSVYSAALVPIGVVIGNTGFEIAVGLAGFFWLIRCILVRHNPFTVFLSESQARAWLAWYAVIVVSLLWNGPGSKGFAHDIIFFRHLLFLVALLDIARRREVGRYLLYGLGAGVFWAAANTLLAFVIGSDLFGRPLARYTGKLKEASRIAGLCAYAVPFFLSWSIWGKKIDQQRRTVMVCLGILAAVLLVQIHIRTAMLAAFVGLVFAWVNHAAFSWRKTTVLAAAVSAAGFGVSCIVPPEELYSMFDRFHIWKVGWKIWLDYPLLGTGVSSFQDVFTQIAVSGMNFDVVAADGMIFNGLEATHTHNLFLMLLAATGAAGLAAFGWLFVTCVRKIFNTPADWRIGLLSWPAVVFVLALFGYNIYHSWYQALFVFWVALIGTSINSRQKTVDSSQ